MLYMKRLKLLAIAVAALLSVPGVNKAQSRLYPQLFDLGDVQITEGAFLHAQNLNYQVLLQYDLGRLMQPYEKQAGLEESGKAFDNWGGDRGLDGHVGGHYLSALALGYASCADAAMKAQFKDRLDKFVNRMKDCQDAWDNSDSVSMHGYCGGVPHSLAVWTTLANGDFDEYWKSWVPFYNVHKSMAGLRDAWVYGGNETAKTVFLKFCDWGINLISKLTDDQVQGLLGNEHGGINEMYADAYQMTGDAKYLGAAKRYTHKWLLNGMASRKSSTIDNVHANTQVPKVVGFERTYQQDNSLSHYARASKYFWQNVTQQRTIVIGGNSIGEWFPAKKEYGNFITSREGVETCNTNNMMKLTENLFADSHDSKYADFYEKAMFNHILSSQDPRTGGYVYFTPERPQHYRVYSQVNQAMWCCVGTGMENHAKYGEFVYSHKDDSLFVNLFLPTTLDWKEKGVRLTQDTKFPYGQVSKITINDGGSFTLLVRHPSWAEGFKVSVNGTEVSADETKGYLPVTRDWQSGDVVEITLPMKVSVVPLQNYTDYVAFSYGPIALGAKTCADDLDGIYADESRMGHVAGGKLYDLYSAPLLIGSRDDLADAIEMTDADKLHFRINGYYSDRKWSDLVLEPFAGIHEARYMLYWLNVDGEKWQAIKDELAAKEAAEQLLDARTIDYVNTGTQQSESDHYMQQQGSNSGVYNGEYYRDGTQFSYQLQTKGKTSNVTLMCRYWGADAGDREFDIKIDNTVIATEKLTGGTNEFVNKEYEIPESLLVDKTKVRVKFQAKSGNVAGGVYYVRLLMSEEDATTGIGSVNFESPRGNLQGTASVIYTVGGKAFAASRSNLPRGMYIVNGRKVIK